MTNSKGPDLQLLYRDQDIVGVNKPPGLLVHPPRSKRRPRHTLMQMVRDEVGQYVYPVHRLDKPVSGATVFGLSKKAARVLKENWHNDETVKEYVALCFGSPPLEGEWRSPLTKDGTSKSVEQKAITKFRVLHYFENMALVKVTLLTGRKHQIRRHFSTNSFPLVGDTDYGKERWNAEFREKYGEKGLFLHARNLTFVHPFELKKVHLHAPLPTGFDRALEGVTHSEGLELTEITEKVQKT